MATKKKAGSPHKKLFTTAIKKVIKTNSVLPILENVLFDGSHAITSDLHTSVVIPFSSPNANVAVPAKDFLDVLDIMESVEMVQDDPKPVKKNETFQCNGIRYLGNEQEWQEKHANSFDDCPFGEYVERKAIKVPEDFPAETIEYLPQFGVTFSSGKRSIGLTGADPKDFPITPLLDETHPVIGKFTKEDMKHIETALKFTSKDDLRPAMTGLLINDEVVATDAHRLFHHALSSPVTREFILPAKAANLLLAFGGEWTITTPEEYQRNEAGDIVMKHPEKTVLQIPEHFFIGNDAYQGTEDAAWEHYKFYNNLNGKPFIKEEHQAAFEDYVESHVSREWSPGVAKNTKVPDLSQPEKPIFLDIKNVSFTNEEGIQVITRVIDARYPDWKVVWPQAEPGVVLYAPVPLLIEEFKTAGKFANRSTSCVTLGMNGVLSFSSQDIDFGKEYRNEYENNSNVDFQFRDHYPRQHQLNGQNVDIKKDLGDTVLLFSHEEPVEKSALTVLPPDLFIGLNGKFMLDILNCIDYDSAAEIKLFAANKAVIINDEFLIMPLMLNND